MFQCERDKHKILAFELLRRNGGSVVMRGMDAPEFDAQCEGADIEVVCRQNTIDVEFRLLERGEVRRRKDEDEIYLPAAHDLVLSMLREPSVDKRENGFGFTGFKRDDGGIFIGQVYGRGRDFKAKSFNVSISRDRVANLSDVALAAGGPITALRQALGSELFGNLIESPASTEAE